MRSQQGGRRPRWNRITDSRRLLMSASSRRRFMPIAGVVAIALSGVGAYMQGDVLDPARNSLPNPTKTVVTGWGPLPDGRMWGNTAGVAGNGPETFNEPNDVITAPNGDIFVSDGHSGQNPNPPPNANGRIVKFTKDGRYIKEWGKVGSGPGEFRTPHALAFDSKGRLFVADRGNHRIQIFDQDGKLLDEWKQFGRVSGLFIRNDMLYAIDS